MYLRAVEGWPRWDGEEQHGPWRRAWRSPFPPPPSAGSNDACPAHLPQSGRHITPAVALAPAHPAHPTTHASAPTPTPTRTHRYDPVSPVILYAVLGRPLDMPTLPLPPSSLTLSPNICAREIAEISVRGEEMLFAALRGRCGVQGGGSGGMRTRHSESTVRASACARKPCLRFAGRTMGRRVVQVRA